MLKEKLQTAVAELKKVYTLVRVQPGSGDGVIDIALEPANLHASSGDLAALKILSAQGLQARGYVNSRDFKTLFLRNISELTPAPCPLTPDACPMTSDLCPQGGSNG
jgi:hypothetical protein